jgi:tight adherence protein C
MLLTEHPALVTMLIALAIGAAVALLAGVLGRVLATVPVEDREYKDTPPLGFRVIWWPVQWVSHFIAPFISERRQTAVLTRLRQTGLDYTISPAQFIASRIVAATIGVLLFWWGMATFNNPAPGEEGAGLRAYLQAGGIGGAIGFAYPAMWLRDLVARRKNELLKTLPFYLDIITLCVEAGLNMQGAMQQAVAKGPKGVLRDEFQRVLRDIRAGKGRADSLRGMAERLNESTITSFTTAVIQAESMGMNLGPVLRAQADQRRSERFMRAEKLAMEAPVKLLFPLIAFIFPCTFIVLFFPIIMKFMHSGF